jgi:hypothetical protein
MTRRSEIEHAQLMVWAEVGGDEGADVAGATDEQDLHTA